MEENSNTITQLQNPPFPQPHGYVWPVDLETPPEPSHMRPDAVVMGCLSKSRESEDVPACKGPQKGRAYGSANSNHSVVTHQPSPLSLWFWGDSLPGYAMAFTILLAFSREDVCGH